MIEIESNIVKNTGILWCEQSKEDIFNLAGTLGEIRIV